MKAKKTLSILLCTILTLMFVPNAAYGADTGKTIFIEIRDGVTREDLGNTDIMDQITYELYDSSDNQIQVRLTEEGRLKVEDVSVGEGYRLLVGHGDCYASNEIFTIESEREFYEVSLYKIADVTEVEASAVSAIVRSSGSSGVDVSIIAENLPESLTADEFFVVLIPGTSWDVETRGLPAGMNEAPPESMDITRHEDATPDEYVLFVGFLRSVYFHEDQEHPSRILSGFFSQAITVIEPDEDPGPPPGGGGVSGEIVFEYSSTNPESTEQLAIPFDTNSDWYLVECPYSAEGSIAFPAEFDGKELTLLGLSVPFWMEDAITLDNFGGEIEGNVLAFDAPFKRIKLDAELEGEDRIYSFVFCQPGYESVVLDFSLAGKDTSNSPITEEYSATVNGADGIRDVSFTLPEGLASADITMSIDVSELDPEQASEQADLPVGGGIWEYLVDRSDFVSSKSSILTVSRYFGKVTMHYQYQYGNSWEDAMITFFEPDFVGIDILPELDAGDYHSGITNATRPDEMVPSAFVYFLNRRIMVKPSQEGGRQYAINRISSALDITADEVSALSDKELEALHGHNWNDPETGRPYEGSWIVTLPSIEKPVTRLDLNVTMTDSSETVDIPLDIIRVLLDSFSHEYDEGNKLEIIAENTVGDVVNEPLISNTPRGTPYEYYDEPHITFVAVFGSVREPEDPEWFSFDLDHTLLVMYYKGAQILGTKQFPIAPSSPEEYEEMKADGRIMIEVPVFRKGHYDSLAFDSADRITAFLIDKEGISSSDSSFGGAIFGVGAGWGHLLPNHADYGSGKDGMHYE